MVMVLAENIFYAAFCIWNQNLHAFHLLFSLLSFGLFPKHHNISLWLLCMCDLEQPTTVVSKLGYRQAHVLEEGSGLWIHLSAGSCCLPGENGANREGFFFVPEKFFVQGGIVSVAQLCFWWPRTSWACCVVAWGLLRVWSRFKLTCLILGWSVGDAQAANSDLIWGKWK